MRTGGKEWKLTVYITDGPCVVAYYEKAEDARHAAAEIVRGPDGIRDLLPPGVSGPYFPLHRIHEVIVERNKSST